MVEILGVQVDVAYWLGLLGSGLGAFVVTSCLLRWLKPFDAGAAQRDFDELDRDRERWIAEWVDFQNRVTPIVADKRGFLDTWNLTDQGWDDSVLPVHLAFERQSLVRRMVEIRDRSAKLYKSIGT